MKLKTIVSLLSVAILGMVSCTAKEKDQEMAPSGKDGAQWMTSLDEAKAAAASRKVPILANFSGSDWCSWCIRLDKEVFSTKAFQDYAARNLVLLSLDFPRSTPQSDALRDQNKALSRRFNVEGFPTVILMDATGKELARTGYQPGGASAYVNHLQGLLKK